VEEEEVAAFPWEGVLLTLEDSDRHVGRAGDPSQPPREMGIPCPLGPLWGQEDAGTHFETDVRTTEEEEEEEEEVRRRRRRRRRRKVYSKLTQWTERWTPSATALPRCRRRRRRRRVWRRRRRKRGSFASGAADLRSEIRYLSFSIIS